MHTIHLIHNNIFKDIKIVHVADLSGPSSGSSLTIVERNLYQTIFRAVADVEELVGFFRADECVCVAKRTVTQRTGAARGCIGGIHGPHCGTEGRHGEGLYGAVPLHEQGSTNVGC